MDVGDINAKCEDYETRTIASNAMSSYCFLNNLLTSNPNKYSFPNFNSETVRPEIPPTDLVYFEIPLDSVDVRPHAQDYFCSLQKCFNSFTSINEENHPDWSHSSREYSADFTEEIGESGDAEDNFLLKWNTAISERVATDVSFEEDDFKGLYQKFLSTKIN